MDLRGEFSGECEASFDVMGDFSLNMVSSLHWISCSDLLGRRMDNSIKDKFLELFSLSS